VRVRGIHRVEWLTRPGNTASRNVARRLGMRLDGVLREQFLHRGVRHDTEVWSLLAPEWVGPSGSPDRQDRPWRETGHDLDHKIAEV
jgi:RimJ/RimL family protein N-acetyltransferase